ncbi:MAG: hypothetical protein R3266_03390 [Gemmatimonadota bacterium]|nr:hypothetical protein [Gemmatimonadota bacterium]
MTARYFAGSLTRISDLGSAAFDVETLDRDAWGDGDYVVARVLEPGESRRIELPTGRLTSLETGDRLIGALGVRHATLEATGDWRDVGPDLRMELLTGAGLLGRATSVSAVLGRLARLAYEGHVVREGKPVRMRDFVRPVEPRAWETPTVLIIGTSMSAGKTATARAAIRRLVERGLSPIGAKLTGAGRYRDILTMRDAGADRILDFVDAGLPSSVGAPEDYRASLAWMLSRLAEAEADAAVIEAGASPLEPYNGSVAFEGVAETVRFLILAASDPYAVLGVMRAFGVTPDLVTGIATNTRAGRELVERLTGVPALNVMDPRNREAFGDLLEAALREVEE